MKRKGKFRFAILLKDYNRAVKKQFRILTKKGYNSLKEDAKKSFASNGKRFIEISHFYTKTGNPVCLEF